MSLRRGSNGHNSKQHREPCTQASICSAEHQHAQLVIHSLSTFYTQFSPALLVFTQLSDYSTTRPVVSSHPKVTHSNPTDHRSLKPKESSSPPKPSGLSSSFSSCRTQSTAKPNKKHAQQNTRCIYQSTWITFIDFTAHSDSRQGHLVLVGSSSGNTTLQL